MSNKKTSISAIVQGGKGKGKGKGKAKGMEETKENNYREPLDYEDSKIKYPGAIKKNKYVLAVMRDNTTWCVAKIMEVRNKVDDPDVLWGIKQD